MGLCITDENVYHMRITCVSQISIPCITCVSRVYHRYLSCIMTCVSQPVSRGPGDTGEGQAIHSNVSAEVPTRIMEISDLCIMMSMYQCISVYHEKSITYLMYHHDTRDIRVIPSTDK
jgi:hypothetical protein